MLDTENNEVEENIDEDFDIEEEFEENVDDEDFEDQPDDEDDEDYEDDEDEEVDFNKDFLEKFEVTYDQNPRKFENVEELQKYAQLGLNSERISQRNEEYKSNPAYAYIDGYMKEKGYSDPNEFVKAIKINQRVHYLTENGMDEEKALEDAQDYVDKTFKPSQSVESKEISNLVAWQAQRVKDGKTEGIIDPNKIPQQVLDSHKNGQPLKEAFLEYELDNIKGKTEQDTLKKLEKNKKTSTGPIDKSQSPKKGKALTADQYDAKLDKMSDKQQRAYIDKHIDAIEKSGYFSKF